MQSVEQEALKTYQNNLEFLSQNHPDIYTKIQNLNNSTQNGNYISQYDLEYLNPYFDVKQIQTQNYLYADDSLQISQALTQQVNHNKDSFSFEGFPLYYKIEDCVDEMDDKTQGLKGIYPIMSYYIDTIERSSVMKQIEKFIFVGVGLGLHLLSIHQKIDAKEYLIIEDDLELFNLSLFCTKYYDFGADVRLYFSIADDENNFMNVINNFLEDSFYINRYLKYSYFPAHSDTKLKWIQNALISQDFISFPYKTLLTKYLKPLEYIDGTNNILNFTNRFTHSTFSNKPMLVLGAGPSLQNNIKWLEENQQYFVIMAVSSTLKTLHKHNIKPDIITHMDGFDNVLKVYEGFDVKEFTKDSIVIFGSFIPEKVREKFNKENCFFTEEDTYYFEDFNSLVGPCIGSTSLLYALMLDTKEIYTLGTDFAVDSKTGQTHSNEHITKDVIDIQTKDELKKVMSFKQNLFKVEGNFERNVYTNSLFQVSLQSLHNRIPILKESYQTLYNLNNGAKIHQVSPLQIKDIELKNYQSINKKELFIEIKQTLKKNSVTTLSNADKDSLQQRIVFAKEVQQHLQKHLNTSSRTNSDTYLYDLLGVVSQILQKQTRETNNLVKIYYLFFKYTLPLIMDTFNTKGLKNEKRHIKKLDKMLTTELLNIEKIYKEGVEAYLN